VLVLLQAGFDVTVIDNLCNSSDESLSRVSRLAGKFPRFVKADIRDRGQLYSVFAERRVSAVIHFAGLKAVGESVRAPLRYYDNNVAGTLRLCEAMTEHGVFTLVFSSSATVYGAPPTVPISEDQPLGTATNPYGRSKLMVEQLLTDLAASDARWRVALLRYFNPVGAHESGLIGEDPNGIPNNLLPYIAQVAAGRLRELSVFGNDYPTPDGTGVRDYIHVVDLAAGHVAAMQKLDTMRCEAINLGTGRGSSVLEVVKAFEKVNAVKVPFTVKDRRPGDVTSCFADPSAALHRLGWKTRRNLEDMCPGRLALATGPCRPRKLTQRGSFSAELPLPVLSGIARGVGWDLPCGAPHVRSPPLGLC
jgi:UDP-glucose 4-epimerase